MATVFNGNKNKFTTVGNAPVTDTTLVASPDTTIAADPQATVVPSADTTVVAPESAAPSVDQVVPAGATTTDTATLVATSYPVANVGSTPTPPQPQKGYIPVYTLELELTNYAAAMDTTKSLTLEETGAWQYSLFHTLYEIFNSKDQQEFNNKFNTVFAFFYKNKDGVFNEKFIFRAPMTWPGSQKEFTLYRRLVFTIIQLANPEGRAKALSAINLALVTEGLTEDQRSKFIALCS